MVLVLFFFGYLVGVRLLNVVLMRVKFEFLI